MFVVYSAEGEVDSRWRQQSQALHIWEEDVQLLAFAYTVNICI